MGEVISSLADAIERVYRSFILRDLLGFILPGSISLLSTSYLISKPPNDFFNWLVSFRGAFDPASNPTIVTEVIVFLILSYLTAWVLQSIHYGIVDWVFRFPVLLSAAWRKHDRKVSFLRRVRNLLLAFFQALMWPFGGGIFYYTRKVSEFKDKNNNTEELSPSLITRGALAPDKAFKRIKSLEGFSIVAEKSSPYTERVSALMLMTGNTSIAGLLLLFVLWPTWYYWLIGIILFLLLYLEYWRLWYARNLRHEIYIDIASQVKSSSDSDSETQNKKPGQ